MKVFATGGGKTMRQGFIILGLVIACSAGCRTKWQKPDRVVKLLKIRPENRVADVGAGDGFFVEYLSKAVGPSGVVYAVEIDAERVSELKTLTNEENLTNVRVTLGQADDPLLPDRKLDLIFLCNAYHHIENRKDYFSGLRADLRKGGRIAIIEMTDDSKGFLGVFVRDDHSTNRAVIVQEMREAGYLEVDSYDFLPIQNFTIFEPIPATP